jgi:hypothetical protein
MPMRASLLTGSALLSTRKHGMRKATDSEQQHHREAVAFTLR